MARVVVAGGSLAGLLTALALAERGHCATVVEREEEPAAQDGLVPRPSGAVPQVVHPHFTGPGFVAALHRAAPGSAGAVLALLEAGDGGLVRLVERMPGTVRDRSPVPGDDDLVAPTARRPLLERSLRAVAAATPGVRLLTGSAVCGLEVRRTDPPRVTGALVEGLGVLPADVVVDATGRRSRSTAWLRAAGAPTPRVELDEDCGNVYHSRTFRLLEPGFRPTDLLRGVFGSEFAPSHLAAVFLSDSSTLQVTIGRLPEDDELAALRHDGGWTAAARCFDLARAWTHPDVAEPLTGVATMAGLRTTVRRLCDAGGRPLVHGLLLLGDACSTTNPAFGRGMALAALHAGIAAEAVDAAPTDPGEVVERVEREWERVVGPHVADALERDRARLALVRPGAEPPLLPPGRLLQWSQVMGLSAHDPVLWREVYRAVAVMTEPEQLLHDPAIAARVASLPPPPQVPVPPREQLADVLAGALL